MSPECQSTEVPPPNPQYTHPHNKKASTYQPPQSWASESQLLSFLLYLKALKSVCICSVRQMPDTLCCMGKRGLVWGFPLVCQPDYCNAGMRLTDVYLCNFRVVDGRCFKIKMWLCGFMPKLIHAEVDYSTQAQLHSSCITARTKRDHWVSGLPRHWWYTVSTPTKPHPGIKSTITAPVYSSGRIT